jgi:hypothetical protein
LADLYEITETTRQPSGEIFKSSAQWELQPNMKLDQELSGGTESCQEEPGRAKDAIFL